ncbi:MAG: YaaR family protein [Treponema sp.]|nr:YaaR family protein [Treponema sp.]
MSEINPLGASTYYSGLQNATSQAAKEQKKDKTRKTGQLSFSQILQSKGHSQEELKAMSAGYPPEIAKMSIEDAAVFLRDKVDTAGNALSISATTENIQAFRESVQLFIKYIVDNNYLEHRKQLRGFSSPLHNFSNFNQKKRPRDPRLTIETINQKLDSMVRDTLSQQAGNLKMLDRVNEIKGLIVDLMQG